MKITANIITLNEEHNIKACIESLQDVCDEIIVVDSNSSDATVMIAKSLGAKIVMQEYLGDGFQKNVVLKYATYDWILSIDADERVDAQMSEAIQKVKSASIHPEAYSFKRKNYIGDRWIKVCGWYPDRCTRLYNKNATKFKEVMGHSSVQSRDVKPLEGNIIHYSYKNYHDLLNKTNRFSSRGAKMLLEKDKKANGFSPFLHFMAAFFRKYFLQRGFMQGLDGLTISLTASINSYMKYAKLIEMRNAKESSQSLWEQ
ncbi:glycosyl transferase, family 2 [hydrothermal vent metagenome]|uniref:Glycosyl transferase, family 2 n=1 Tax=hydrothermal vent metagenome TaxID=652676 RepID=A0A1W1CNK3_9ZZZZ